MEACVLDGPRSSVRRTSKRTFHPVPLTDLPQPSLQSLLHTSTTPRKTALSSISIIPISQTDDLEQKFLIIAPQA
jgi:hypothetical protein